MKIKYYTCLAVLLVSCTNNRNQPPFPGNTQPSATVEPSPTPSTQATPTAIPTAPVVTPSVDPSPSPSPSASSPSLPDLKEPSSLPLSLYTGKMAEGSIDRFINLQRIDPQGNGLILWYGAQEGIELKAYNKQALFNVNLPAFGPAVAGLDASGNGLVAWRTSLPTAWHDEPVKFLYTQKFENYKPSGAFQKHGEQSPIAIGSDASGNGYLMFSNPSKRISDYEILARPIKNAELLTEPKKILDLPGGNRIEGGYINASGDGLVFYIHYLPEDGQPNMMVSGFKNLQEELQPLVLDEKVRGGRSWLHAVNVKAVVASSGSVI